MSNAFDEMERWKRRKKLVISNMSIQFRAKNWNLSQFSKINRYTMNAQNSYEQMEMDSYHFQL